MTPSRPGRGWRFVDHWLDGPWETADLVSLASFLALGAAGLVVAGVGTRSVDRFTGQQGWTAAGVAALAVAFVGIASWLKSGMRRLRELEADTYAAVAQATGYRAAQEAQVAAAAGPDVLVGPAERLPATVVTGRGMSRFHDPSCVFAVGKEVTAVTAATAARRDLVPCGVCLR